MTESFLIVNKSNIDYLINERKWNEVRLSPSNEFNESGIFLINDLFAKAINLNLDFVIINQKTKPVIGKIIDYQKFLYIQKKIKKEQDKKNKVNAIKIKEVKFHLNIGKNDYDYKIKHINDFIEKGYKVKCQIFLRGREREFDDQIENLSNQIIESCSAFSKLVENINYQGNTINFAFIKG